LKLQNQQERPGHNMRHTEKIEIPEDWNIAKGEELFNLSSGLSPSRIFFGGPGGDTLFVQIDDMNKMANSINIVESKLKFNKIENPTVPIENAGTIVFPKRGASIMTNKVRILGKKSAIDPNIMALSCKTLLDPSYFYHYLVNLKLYNLMENAGLPQLNNKDLYPHQFVLPPFDEQQKIAAILSKVDQLIQKVVQIIEQTQRLKKGLMQKLLTGGIGHTRFKKVRTFFAQDLEIPEEWEIVQLKDIADVRYGLSQPPEIDEEGVPMIRATNIKKGLIYEKGLLRIKGSSIPNSKDVYLQQGDIIVVRSGAYTGDIGYISKQFQGAIAGYDLIVSPTIQVNPIWFTNYLLSPRVQNYFSQLKSRVAQPHLNAQELSNTQVYLPSLHEQKRIAATVSIIDNRIELEKRKKLQHQSIKEGLMQKLLTGKIRVKI